MNNFANLNLSIPDLWEVRDVYNKVKSVVLNYTEMEAKVHEATNNEAWGASSTAMQELAQATQNYQYFNEIMPTIYKRFTEKEAKYWRQIYKALVLLEYLVKNGSERVVDDARSHISMIKMMKNFHYVDEKGKDQGINVRNRAKELAELLNNMDLIKAERKKAKINRNKYTGVGSEGSSMGFSGGGGGYGGSGSRFEGFGNSTNDFSTDNYGSSSDFYNEDERSGRYDEPEEFSSSSKKPGHAVTKSDTKAKTANDLNLFDFDDEPVKTQNVTKDEDDWGDFANGDSNDDFDDFQSAPVVSTPQKSHTTTPPPKPAHTQQQKKNNDLFDLFGEDSFTPQTNTTSVSQTTASFTGLSISQQPTPSSVRSPAQVNPTPSKPVDTTPIGGIWSSGSNLFSLDSLGSKSTTSTKPDKGPSINAIKTQALNNDWSQWANTNTNTNQQQQQQQQQTKQSSVFDDLLF